MWCVAEHDVAEWPREGSTGTFTHLGDDHVYSGHVWHVVSGEFVAPTGEKFRRDIVRSPGAVAVVPLLESTVPDVVLVRQYRAAFDDYVIEVPAGMRDIEGELPEETARRELLEETGYIAGSLTLLHSFFPSPGMTDSILHVYLGRELSLVQRAAQGPEENHMDVFIVPLRTAVEMVVDGRIRDAKSVIGLLLTQRIIDTR